MNRKSFLARCLGVPIAAAVGVKLAAKEKAPAGFRRVQPGTVFAMDIVEILPNGKVCPARFHDLKSKYGLALETKRSGESITVAIKPDYIQRFTVA